MNGVYTEKIVAHFSPEISIFSEGHQARRWKMARRQNGTTYRLSSTSNKDVVKRTYRRGKLVGEETIRRNTMPKSAKLGGNG